MAFEFKFPDVGEGITEGTVVKWLVKEGDEVKADQALAEVETDKAIVELPSPRTGKILALKAKEGEEIKVGQVIVEIETHGEEAQPAGNEDSTGVVGSISTEVTVLKEEVPEHVAAASAPTVQATPAIRKLAKDMGVDLNTVKGTGTDGRITEEDVKNAGGKVATPAPAVAAPAADSAGAMKKVRKYDMWGYVDHVPYKGMRKAIGDAMVKSAMTTAPVTQTEIADITDLVALRKKEKVEAEKEGIKLTYLAYIMKAVQAGLEAHPMLNATLDDANADIVVKKYYNFGFAVDTGDGLLVPVIKRVNQKKLFEIAKEIDDLAEKARSRKIDPMELKGGGFTITNIGSIGGLFATPVINHPEVAILGLGRLHEAPLVREGKIEARWVLPLSLTYDHRVIDGAEAARFMNTFVEKLTKVA